ncbi:Xylosyltransferase 1 [Spatholobus suberectus]|nr:Xylosyltransferase 1 [Spatholobus suberectus]
MTVPGGWCIGSRENGTDPCSEIGDTKVLRPGQGSKRLETLISSLLSNEKFRPGQSYLALHYFGPVLEVAVQIAVVLIPMYFYCICKDGDPFAKIIFRIDSELTFDNKLKLDEEKEDEEDAKTISNAPTA